MRNHKPGKHTDWLCYFNTVELNFSSDSQEEKKNVELINSFNKSDQNSLYTLTKQTFIVELKNYYFSELGRVHYWKKKEKRFSFCICNREKNISSRFVLVWRRARSKSNKTARNYVEKWENSFFQPHRDQDLQLAHRRTTGWNRRSFQNLLWNLIFIDCFYSAVPLTRYIGYLETVADFVIDTMPLFL
jgi:hypothetical protein